MFALTILTPTYNRKNELMKLRQCLLNQSSMDFQWLVIDDGSTDGTEELFEYSDDCIKTDYIKKTNGGKASAINYAHQFIQSDIVAIVDSDDQLEENAVEIIVKNWTKHKVDPNICGMVYLRKHPNEEGEKKVFPSDGYISSYVDMILNTNIDGGGFEVVRKSLLEEFPFPEYENENFIGESYLWTVSGLKYKMAFYNLPIYIYDFLDGGLTSQGRLLRIKNPQSSMAVMRVGLGKQIAAKRRIKNAILYVCYGKFARKRRKEIFEVDNKGIVMVAYLPGVLLHKYWKHKFKINV